MLVLVVSVLVLYLLAQLQLWYIISSAKAVIIQGPAPCWASLIIWVEVKECLILQGVTEESEVIERIVNTLLLVLTYNINNINLQY